MTTSASPSGLWTPRDNAPYSGYNPHYDPKAVKHIIMVQDDCCNQDAFGHAPRHLTVPYWLMFCFTRPDRRNMKALFVCKAQECKEQARHALGRYSEPRTGVWSEVELTGRCCAPGCPHSAYRYGIYVEPSSSWSHEVLGGELCLAHDILNSSDKRIAAAFEKNPHRF